MLKQTLNTKKKISHKQKKNYHVKHLQNLQTEYSISITKLTKMSEFLQEVW